MEREAKGEAMSDYEKNKQTVRDSTGIAMNAATIDRAGGSCNHCRVGLSVGERIIVLTWRMAGKDVRGGMLCSACWKDAPSVLAAGLQQAGKDVGKVALQEMLDSAISKFPSTTIH